jgi:hypothetical protein
MKMQTGCRVLGNVRAVPGQSISFVNGEGRVVFEVSVNSETSIEVRGSELIKHDDVIYSELLSVRPRHANSVEVHRLPYDQGKMK